MLLNKNMHVSAKIHIEIVIYIVLSDCTLCYTKCYKTTITCLNSSVYCTILFSYLKIVMFDDNNRDLHNCSGLVLYNCIVTITSK